MTGIATKELVPIVIAAAIWGSQWKGQGVCFHSDNMAVVAVIKKNSSHDPSLMHLLRCLCFFAAYYQFHCSAEHIAGVSNIAADALSRDNPSLFCSMCPQVPRVTVCPVVVALLVSAKARLGLRELDGAVHSLFSQGLAPSTEASYDTGLCSYLQFCTKCQLQPLPLVETTLCCFVAYLHNDNKSFQTIRTHLCTIRHLQIASGLPDPSLSCFPRLRVCLLRSSQEAISTPKTKAIASDTCHSLVDLPAVVP